MAPPEVPVAEAVPAGASIRGLPMGEVIEERDLSFTYVRNTEFDKFGVLYNIGTNFGSERYSNPQTSGRVRVEFSPDGANYYSGSTGHRVGDYDQAAQVISEHVHRGNRATMWSKGAANAWFQVDLKSYALRCSHYCYRGDAGGGNNHPRTWDLQGSNDGSAWVTLRSHSNESTVNMTTPGSWDVSSNEFFRIFRIQNRGAPNHLCCSGLELYGSLVPIAGDGGPQSAKDGAAVASGFPAASAPPAAAFPGGGGGGGGGGEGGGLAAWVGAYPTGGAGPRPDQLGAYGWFEGQGWKDKWPLHHAAMRGDVARIKQLCSQGHDPNVKMTDWFDSEPLGWSASFGQLAATVALIQCGADPLRPANKAGNTPLTDAQRERHQTTISFLEEYQRRAAGSGGGGTITVQPGGAATGGGGGGSWQEYRDIDMCMQGDVEIIHNWRSTHSIDDLKRIVQEKGYSCFTVSSGNPSFGHAALKKFPYQVTKDHCKPISQCCRHPCTIYIYHPPSSGAVITAQPGAQGTGPEWTNPRPKISAEEIAGCWCCACIPGGCALYAKEARGPDALVHKGLALIFFGLPICFEEHRTRHPNTNGFFKNGEPGNIDTYSSKDCACNGSACNIRIFPGGGSTVVSTVVSGQPVPHGNDPNWTAPYPKIETHEIAGCWLCGCIPGGCAIYQKQQKEPDVMVHKGCFFLFWAIPMFFAEDRIRHPNTNGFYKRGEPGNVESYSSARCGGGGGACAFKICDC